MRTKDEESGTTAVVAGRARTSLGRFTQHAPEVVEARYWAQVEKSDGCWLWTGRLTEFGHGLAGRWPDAMQADAPAHHVAWKLSRGEWKPAGSVVRHTCDTPACVRPDHLELGTHADNVADRVARGRSAIGVRSGRAVLNEALVTEIIGKLHAGRRCASIARDYGVDHGTVRSISQGKTWRHVRRAS